MLCWLLLACAFVGTALSADFVVGQKFQIILSSIPNVAVSPLIPTDAIVYDIDVWDSDVDTISGLHKLGKIVICYFSSGTSEDWRSDFSQFSASDMGKELPEWRGERWLRLSSANVRSIMTNRIQMAADKGCDAIDPDNTDGFQNDNGLNLQAADSIDYVKFLASTATSYGMSIGLKNSMSILPDVSSLVQFAVNEQCSKFSECADYSSFITSGKPVFHIEYPNNAPKVAQSDLYASCQAAGQDGLSTVMKTLNLTGWVEYCDGSTATTPTKDGMGTSPWGNHTTVSVRPTTKTTGTPTTSLRPTTTSSTRPTTTPKSSTTLKPTTKSTTSSAKPTTSSTGGSGCLSKHWDQCAGQDWKGCKACESPYQCKYSNPYYSQCL